MRTALTAIFLVMPFGAFAAGPTIGSNIKKVSTLKVPAVARTASTVGAVARYPSIIMNRPAKPSGGSGGSGGDFDLASDPDFIRLSAQVEGMDSYLNALPDFSGFATKEDLANVGVPDDLQSWMDGIESQMDGVRGKSAYDIAVENGFSGTESAWLASLKGAPGEAGEPGAPGRDGDNGQDGAPGRDGDNGIAMPAADGVYIMNKTGAGPEWVGVEINDVWEN